MKILRKIKDKLRKIAQIELSPKKTKKVSEPFKREVKKEIPPDPEVAIEQAKFLNTETTPKRADISQELPSYYDQDKIVLLVRDPWWIYAYWQIKGSTLEKIKNELKDDFFKAIRVLRVYDISYIIFTGNNAHRFFDIQIDEHAANWYIDTQGPGKSWCVDLGLLLPDGRFITILRSNTVQTPLDRPSWISDEEWMIPEDMFARLYGMGFGLGRSSLVGRSWQERVKGILSSLKVSSVTSPVKKEPDKK